MNRILGVTGMRSRRTAALALLILTVLSLTSCGTGLTGKQRETVDKTIAEYSEKLIGPT